MRNNLEAEAPLTRRGARTPELQSTKPTPCEIEIVHIVFLVYEVRTPNLREFKDASIWVDLIYYYMKKEKKNCLVIADDIV